MEKFGFEAESTPGIRIPIHDPGVGLFVRIVAGDGADFEPFGDEVAEPFEHKSTFTVSAVFVNGMYKKIIKPHAANSKSSRQAARGSRK